MRPNRIKTYTFTPTELTASAGGTLSLYTNHSLNGMIQKIEYLGGNQTATGSLIFTVSGTGENLFNFKSGTIPGNVASGLSANYLFTYAENSAGATGSPQAFTQYSINGVVRIQGSGLGNGTSGLGLNIVYI